MNWTSPTANRTGPSIMISRRHNLSDVEEPFVVGELEITGYSSYLQPLNNNFMLGIGYGDNNGGTNGLKISVYDISDKTNPIPLSFSTLITSSNQARNTS